MPEVNRNWEAEIAQLKQENDYLREKIKIEQQSLRCSAINYAALVYANTPATASDLVANAETIYQWLIKTDTKDLMTR